MRRVMDLLVMASPFITGLIAVLVLLLLMGGCTAKKVRMSYTDPETGHGGSITIEEDVVSIEGSLPNGISIEVDGAPVDAAGSCEP